ncbi:MAG: response regulator [Desulfobacterota bacterium]|nr:response regulator [Thermodesulfobacteriota bacterium]
MKQINVLIVDDDRDVLHTLSEILAELRVNPVTAADGVEALEKIKTRKIDLIITDLMMPNLDGFELINRVRQVNANIPIAVISGHGEVKNVVTALSRGAFNFITKPFTIKEIEQVVKRGLRLREFSLGTHRLLEGIRNTTEMEIPNYPHLIPSAALYIIRECQWRGIEDEALLSNISICVDELLQNALIHGNDLDESKKIMVRLFFDHERFSMQVEDEGKGFDYHAIMNTFRDDVQSLPTKRGLFIVNYLMDELSFNQKGNQVTMVKYFKQPESRVLH